VVGYGISNLVFLFGHYKFSADRGCGGPLSI